jgi:hypothetical protein
MQAVQAIHTVQHIVPVLSIEEYRNGIQNILVSCHDCDTVWYWADCERCPRCDRQVGTRYFLNQEQIYELLNSVYQIDEERIERASEYETWSFGNILRQNAPWYDVNCRRTIQACYELLCEEELNPKIVFAIGFFEQEYLRAPEDRMMYHFAEEDDYQDWTDEEDW